MKNWLYPGARVVCVNVTPLSETAVVELVQNKVYTVRWVGSHKHPLLGEDLCVRLEGIHRGTCPVFGVTDVPFMASRFRPLHDNSKTIEDLARMMRDHVANASGGLGIRKPVNA